MKLNAKTLEVIENFASINPSLLFREGNILTTKNALGTIVGIAKLDQEFNREFAIYDLGKFLSVLSLFKEPDLEFGEKQVTINSEKQKIRFTYADPEAIVKGPAKAGNFPEATIQFSMSSDLLKTVLKAAGALSVPNIAIVGDDGKIVIKAYDQENPTGDTFQYEIGETQKNFTVVFKKEYLQILPFNYEVSIIQKGDQALSNFKSDYIDYYVAVEKKGSKFE